MLVQAVAIPLLLAAGALAGRVWPLLMRDRAERHRQAQESLESEARREKEAHDRVRAEYAEFFVRQRAEIAELRKDRAHADTRTEELFREIRNLTQVHADCLVKNERLSARVEVLESTLDQLKTHADQGRVPTRNEALVIVDEGGIIQQWNEAATAIFHWQSYEVVGRPAAVLVPPRLREAYVAGWAEVIGTGRPVRRGPHLFEAQTKDGMLVPVEVILSSWADPATHPGRVRRQICAAIRQRPRGPRGETAEDEVDLTALAAAPTPASARKAEAETPGDAPPPPAPASPCPPGPAGGGVGVKPAEGGGADIHLPPDATATVRHDSIQVEVDPNQVPEVPGGDDGTSVHG